MTRPLHIALLLGVLALGAGAGCVAHNDGAPQPHQMCNVDFLCASGDTCAADGQCYGPVSDPDTLAVEVIPAADDPANVRQEFLGKAGSTSLSVQLETPHTVTGFVRLGSSAGATGSKIDARLVARRPSRLPGGADVVVEAPATAKDGFQLRLPPGEVWQIIVFPKDGADSLDGPPVPFAQLVGQNLMRDFNVPAPSELKKARGVLQNAIGEPLVDVPVQMFGRLPSISGEVVASQSVRTADDGSFQLAMPVGLHSEYRLVVNGNQSKPAMPEVSFPGVVIPDPTNLAMVKDLGTLSLPSFGTPQPSMVEIQGTTIAGGTEKAIGARVVFTTEWSESAPGVAAPCVAGARCARFRREKVVDATGSVVVDLLPGTSQNDRSYDVAVLTLSISDFASRFGIRVIVTEQGGLLAPIMLAPKVRLTGQVSDLMGAPLGDVEIVARPVLDPDLTLTASETATVEAFQTPRVFSSMADGSFTVKVEPEFLGRDAAYDLELVPPLESGLPRWVRHDVLVPRDLPSSKRIVNQGTFTPPEPVRVSGLVLAPNQQPLARAEVLVYRLDASCTRGIVGPAPTCLKPTLVARTTTGMAGANGNFSVVLPRSGL